MSRKPCNDLGETTLRLEGGQLQAVLLVWYFRSPALGNGVVWNSVLCQSSISWTCSSLHHVVASVLLYCMSPHSASGQPADHRSYLPTVLWQLLCAGVTSDCGTTLRCLIQTREAAQSTHASCHPPQRTERLAAKGGNLHPTASTPEMTFAARPSATNSPTERRPCRRRASSPAPAVRREEGRVLQRRRRGDDAQMLQRSNGGPPGAEDTPLPTSHRFLNWTPTCGPRN